MFRRFFNGQSKTITSAAIIIGTASLVSRLLGVLRDRVLASEFGAGIELDMYYAAFRVPDLVFNLIVLGALSAGFIPVFSGYLKVPKRAWQLASVLLNTLLVGLVLLTGLLMLLSPWLTKLIAPGFSPGDQAITAGLTRIMFLSPIFLGISGVLGGMLQSFRRFFIYSLAPIMYNIGIILGALYLAPIWGVTGLAWGVVLGALLHMLIQVPAVGALGYRHQWRLDLTNPGLRRIAKMMVPRTLTLVISQLNLFIVTIIGSTLAVGTITIFNFANNLQSLPLGVFAVSYAVAVFPTLSQEAKQPKKFIQTFSLTARLILFLIIPSAALLIVLRAQIVRAVLGAGLFSWEDTVLTLNALSIFAVSLFAQGLILVFIRAFYALQDSKTPFYTGLVSAFANIMLALMLAEMYGVLGLVLAWSLANILNLVLLWLALSFRLGAMDGARIGMSVGKILVASFMLVLTTWATKFAIEPFVGTQTLIGILLQGLTAGVVGIATYFFISRLLGSEELNHLLGGIRQKIRRQPPPPIELLEAE